MNLKRVVTNHLTEDNTSFYTANDKIVQNE